MLGKVFIYATVFFGLISVLTFLLSSKKERKNLQKIGSMTYYAMAVSVISACIYLLANLLAHNFQFTYIWEYSSTELHDYFLVASFYSGQQGSFMLWMLILTIIGLLLHWRTQNKDYNALTMGIYTSIILFVAIILIFKSPFDYVWETFAAENLEVGFMPPNGRGLNPILQNYWITIHPPILFIGYSLMAIPYTFSLTALIRKDYKGWVDAIMPWTLVGTGILGLGIMMGGYWAYETLGWGGFWAWDPVENSSLIPWIIAVAFIHTLIVQKRTNALIKTNFLLGLLSFIFVVYATFLTRSGVLGDTSVHSFVTPGALVYNMLILFQVVYLGLGAGFLIFRFKDINKFVGKKGMSVATKEYSVSLGSIVMLALAAVVIIGTSWPAFAELFGQEKISVDISNYNKFGSIFAIIFLILNALSTYQKWITGKITDILGKIILPVGASLVVVIAFYFLGLDNVTFLLLTFATFFAFISNLEFLVRSASKNPKMIGAYISHLGIAILILGAVISGVYSSTEQLRLQKNETKSAFGYKFTFLDFKQIETEFKDREKYKYNIKIEKDNSVNIASPIVYWSDFNEKQAPFLEPGVSTSIDKDVYIAPKAIEQDLNIPFLELMKEQSEKNPIDGAFNVSVVTFIMDKNAAMMGEKVLLSTVVKYDFGTESRLDTLQSLLDPNSWEAEPEWKKIQNSNIEIAMTKLVRDLKEIKNTKAVLSFKDSTKPPPAPIDVFTFDVTIKPFINLVWLGTLAVVAGFFVALSRYSKSNKKNIAEE
jgi:cytochrome c-type biogenesis protein CcmF